ncbi:MAG: peptide deformylase [Micavibrio aeruginosavorus]|uniref:Peptide deformylase n=1 Tax=Micavibrio aeruginosavorus TaxID=349221 RepID=A0A2W4ZI44_9BACT|nr:MAG: peptide deformylase [Micavibrio aeruginosavorus]
MDKYSIIKLPDPVLKQVASPVSNIDDLVRTQLDRMLETMYAAKGIGLAANQVSLLNRVIVMDTAQREEPETREPICMINPEIIWESEEPSYWDEGCLSIPGQYAEVERPYGVRVKYLDYHGKEQEGLFEGLASHCVQHEIDHLNGVLFIDHLSTLKRNMIMKKFKKAQRDAEPL